MGSFNTEGKLILKVTAVRYTINHFTFFNSKSVGESRDASSSEEGT